MPFVLDYQDPWVGAWGRSVGGGPDGAPDWKSRASRRLGAWLEPTRRRRGRRARRGLAGHDRRHRRAHAERRRGCRTRDSARIRAGRFRGARCTPAAQPRASIRQTACVHLCYVGTLLPTGLETLRLLLRRARARAPRRSGRRPRASAFLRHQQPVRRRARIASCRCARECGVADAVTESAGTARLSRRAVRADARARRFCCSAARNGTTRPASSIPALLAKRPILALFHEASSVVSILRDGRVPSRPSAWSRTAIGRRPTRESPKWPAISALSPRTVAYRGADVVARRVCRACPRACWPGQLAGALRSGGRMTVRSG